MTSLADIPKTSYDLFAQQLLNKVGLATFGASLSIQLNGKMVSLRGSDPVVAERLSEFFQKCNIRVERLLEPLSDSRVEPDCTEIRVSLSEIDRHLFRQKSAAVLNDTVSKQQKLF